MPLPASDPAPEQIERVLPRAPIAATDFRLLLSEHVGAITTVGYLALIAVGLLHEMILFWLFGLNVLDWMGPADFLLAPVRDPLVICAAVAPLPLAWLYWRYFVLNADRLMTKVRGPRDKTPSQRQREKLARPLWYIMLLLWAISAAMWYAIFKARSIRRGDGRPLRIEWVDAARSDTSRAVLIGANASFLVLYRPALDSTQVVPMSQVLRVSVARKRGR